MDEIQKRNPSLHDRLINQQIMFIWSGSQLTTLKALTNVSQDEIKMFDDILSEQALKFKP